MKCCSDSEDRLFPLCNFQQAQDDHTTNIVLFILCLLV